MPFRLLLVKCRPSPLCLIQKAGAETAQTPQSFEPRKVLALREKKVLPQGIEP
jgi:hypothetical protein